MDNFKKKTEETTHNPRWGSPFEPREQRQPIKRGRCLMLTLKQGNRQNRIQGGKQGTKKGQFILVKGTTGQRSNELEHIYT